MSSVFTIKDSTYYSGVSILVFEQVPPWDTQQNYTNR